MRIQRSDRNGLAIGGTRMRRVRFIPMAKTPEVAYRGLTRRAGRRKATADPAATDRNSQPGGNMPNARLKDFLDEHDVKYVSVEHSPAYSAAEVALSAHVADSDFAKTVIIKLEGEMAMAVLPANRRIDLRELRELLISDRVELAKEHEFADRFPDCEIGAMPPFGNLYGLPVYIERDLARHERIAFNGGSHHEIIKMRTRDFAHLVNPMVMDFIAA
jgi:Ala-tRNA(Pro) deacylase